MHAGKILTQLLSSVMDTMHLGRRKVLLNAVEALLQGRRLTLSDLARSWPDATWMQAPQKALDRLLSNRHLHSELSALRFAMAGWLLRGSRPVVLVDWADLKGDGRWCVLRAAVPIGGRSLTLLDVIYPVNQQNTPAAQRDFLKILKHLLGPSPRLIIVTDAGFRSDWYRAVLSQGWDYIGRLRGNVHVCQTPASPWQPCQQLYLLATRAVKDLGTYTQVKAAPMITRLVLTRKPGKGRHHLTRLGTPNQGNVAKTARKGAMEPWLLATSLSDDNFKAAQIVQCYAQRMQIEEGFRDMKSNRYGVGFENSLSRKQARLTVLLMLHTLAQFAAWVMAIKLKTDTQTRGITQQLQRRMRCSWLRIGREWLIQKDLPWRLSNITKHFQQCLQNPVQTTS